MKTVVIVNDHAFVNGGQAKVAIETALALRRVGMSIVFFAGMGPIDQRLRDSGIHCICLDQFDLLSDPDRRRAAVQGLWNRAAASQLALLLSRIDPAGSLVHIHGWAKLLSPSIGPVVTRGPVPHVYTLHEYFLACPNGGFYDRQSQSICTRRPLGVGCLATHCDPRSRAHKAWRVARQAVLWSAGAMPRALRDFIYLSETQLQVMRQFLPARARVHHLPNPVDPPPAGRIRAEDNGLFLFVGRLSPEKGGEVAASAARRAGVPIAFAGRGESEDAIRTANPDAQMLGWLKPDTLTAWLKKARCIVFPSLWYEGFPMVVIEAMQRGLPVLVSERTAAAEVVRHDRDGLHVATGQVEAWSHAMRFMSCDERVARYSLSSFEAARSFIETEAYTTRLISIYRAAAFAQQQERRRHLR